MSTIPNRALAGWNFARKKGLRVIGLHQNRLGNNYEPAKHLMFGRTGRVIKMWDGSQWNRVALWNQENKFGSSTNYFDIDASGIASFVGTAHLPYGSMYNDDNNQVVTVVSAGVVYEVPGNMSDGGSNGFTFQSSKQLRCDVKGKYFCHWSMSLAPASGGDTVSGTVMINSTGVHNVEGSAYFQNANRYSDVSGSGVLSLEVGDIVKLAVENETSTSNVTVTHANLTLLMIGG